MAHLAQVNIAKLTHPIDHPAIAEFKDNLDYINELAESSKGFVWRFEEEVQDNQVIQVYDDPLIIFNMSVWEDIESLKNYVYRSEHLDFFIKRKNWFQKLDQPHMALWWIVEGHIPTVNEAKSKLSMLGQAGDSSEAFTFKKVFSPHNN